MVIHWIASILRFAISLYEIMILIYVLLPIFTKTRSQFTQILARFVEPLLIPLRRILARYLPAKWQRIDWSPLAALILCGIVYAILGIF